MSNIDRRTFVLGSAGLIVLAACGDNGSSKAATPLGISAIPDQDPELLNRLYPSVADRFAKATGLEVRYRPVADYTAVVRAFEIGDIHLAWMGGLTGVQGRARVPGAKAIAQRDIDADFHSLFIATKASGLKPFDEVSGLQAVAGHTLTFGSETSTSGRLMPQYFMKEAGLDVADLKGKPGFSGSHDATIEAVASGSFEVGAVNEQVWTATEEAGEVDLDKVVVLWRTPGYADYHWLARPDVDKVYGAGTTAKVTDLLLGLDAATPADAQILELFGAKKFIPTDEAAYDQIKAVARDLDLVDMTGSAPVVRLRRAGRRFNGHDALLDVDLTIAEGERLAVLGASGAGKTTLLALLNGSLPATSGSVEVFGEDLAGVSAARLRILQRRIGAVSQRLDLVDQVRVLHNVNAGRLARWGTARALASLTWPRADAIARDALHQVGMEWAVYERTERLSGGERQRVAIARLLVQQPALVLADEPVSSLDPARAAETLGLLRVPTERATFVVSLHQPELARKHCTRAIGLREGSVVFDLPVDRLDDALLTDLYALS